MAGNSTSYPMKSLFTERLWFCDELPAQTFMSSQDGISIFNYVKLCMETGIVIY